LISLLYQGLIPKYDLSKVRPAGARLKTFGGRASGPGPLDKLFKNVIKIISNARGRKLNSVECYDICCFILDTVIVGGVRRCLPLNTKILTDKGIRNISEVNINDYIITGGKKYKILDKQNTGKKELLKITHSFGDILCSYDHRIAVFDENNHKKYIFKYAKDLTTNDCLVWDSIGIEGKNTSLPLIEQSGHFNSKLLKTPVLDTNIS
jgi:hypothetical protein